MNEPFDIMEMLGQLSDPSTCINCSKPLADGDQGFDAMLPNSKICSPCMEAKLRLEWTVAQGIDITYRDGTTERIGG